MYSTRVLALILCISVNVGTLYGQADNVGPGRALRFDGIDDYINLGNIMDDLDVPFSVSAWVFIDPGAPGGTYPIVVSQDNAPVYNGFWFCMSPTQVWLEMGDGRGENLPAYRRGRSAPVQDLRGKWTHVAASVSATYNVSLYVNGINVGGAATGQSSLPMQSSAPTDVAKIGYFAVNGNLFRFKGAIDEVRVWNRMLSEIEIRQQMCKKLSGSESGLIGYWDFNETSGNILKDKTANHYDGQLMGNPTRVFSGAPIGDESTFLYTNNWTAKSVSLDITAENVQGNPEGLHIYKIPDTPSQTTGLDSELDTNPYYGVFIASLDQGNTFNLKFEGASLCEAFGRTDNSVSAWTALNTTTAIANRKEIIPINNTSNEIVYLGPDQVICDQTSFLLGTGLTDLTGKTFLWSTGATSQSISVTTSGLYFVEVSDLCNVMKDTVNIIFLKKPDFTLGADGAYCLETPKILEPFDDSSGKVYKWQDGSSNPTFEVTNSGTYWVTIKNICGELTDTIHILKQEIGELNLGPDKIVCDQGSYSFESGITDPLGKTFLWSTGETSASIVVRSSGLYSLQVSNSCETVKDTAHIFFLQKPGTLNLGDDEITCSLQPRLLKPYTDVENINYLWQDGSTGSSFNITDYGTFWVKAENACGVVSDTVHIVKKIEQLKFIPNIITPNDDGLNQFFVLGESSYTYQLILYNRWGKEVFSSSDYKNDWDGEDLPSGVYFYRLSGNCIEEKLGSITLSR